MKKQARACRNVAYNLDHKTETPSTAVRVIYEQSCELGNELGYIDFFDVSMRGEVIAELGLNKDKITKQALLEVSHLCSEETTISCNAIHNIHKAESSAEIYEKFLSDSCILGIDYICWNLATIASERKSYQLATEILLPHCTPEKPRYCARLGVDEGYSGRFSVGTARLEPLCNENQIDACHFLGNLLIHPKNQNKDPERANQLYKYACNIGNTYACASLASNLAIGNGIELNRNLSSLYAENDEQQKPAIQLHFYACQRELYNSCNAAGAMLVRGIKSQKIPVTAEQLFDYACSNNFEESCERLAYLQNPPRPFEVTVEGQIVTCDPGKFGNCGQLGWSLISGNKTASRHPDLGLKVFIHDCSKMNAGSCEALAINFSGPINGIPEDQEKTQLYRVKACALGYPTKCT